MSVYSLSKSSSRKVPAFTDPKRERIVFITICYFNDHFRGGNGTSKVIISYRPFLSHLVLRETYQCEVRLSHLHLSAVSSFSRSSWIPLVANLHIHYITIRSNRYTHIMKSFDPVTPFAWGVQASLSGIIRRNFSKAVYLLCRFESIKFTLANHRRASLCNFAHRGNITKKAFKRYASAGCHISRTLKCNRQVVNT